MDKEDEKTSLNSKPLVQKIKIDQRSQNDFRFRVKETPKMFKLGWDILRI